jgi:hypothetical protein
MTTVLLVVVFAGTVYPPNCHLPLECQTGKGLAGVSLTLFKMRSLVALYPMVVNLAINQLSPSQGKEDKRLCTKRTKP